VTELPKGARVADPASAPLRGSGGSGTRERPTLERAGTRWNARARVVPITGAAGRAPGLVIVGNQPGSDRQGGATMFAAVVEWHGPGLPEFGRSRVAVDALTETICDTEQLARDVALAALELINRGEVPFLDSLRDAMRSPSSWRARYRQLVGNDGRAAAEGF
jgi:hypothetical protein